MKQQNKKTLVIAGVIAAIAAVVAVATLYLTVWSQPTQKDFADAKDKGVKLSGYSVSAISREFTTKIADGYEAGKKQQGLIDSAASEKKKVVEALDARATLAKELGESKVTRDQEVKKLYDTYYAQEQVYSKYFRNHVESYPVYVSSFATCIDVFEFTKTVPSPVDYAEAQRKASKDCFEDLNALEKSGIKAFAQYAKDFKSVINDRQKVFDALERKEINADRETSKKLSDIAARYSKISPVTSLEKARDAASFDGELNRLIDLLGKKAQATT